MFKLSEWLKSGIIDGYKNGHFSFAKVTELTASYLSKNLITETQAQEIAVICPTPIIEKGEETVEDVGEAIQN